ncbi:MAG: sodium:proline symporter, partial [Pseudomonadota bacterium]
TELVLVGRLSVVAVAVVALVLAFDRSSSILSLVSNAWAGFGAAFGPVILLSLFWRGLTRDGALIGMLSGAGTVLFWIYAPVLAEGGTLSSYLYEIIPGFVVCALAAIGVSLATRRPDARITETFDAMTADIAKAIR